MAEQWTDDEIIGAILAGGNQRPIRVRGDFGAGYDIHVDEKPVGPVCAVSAGVLFAGLKTCDDPLESFAEKFGVSREVARGVSCGFEDYYWRGDEEYGEFSRGWAIGAAVRAAIEEES